jgi:hypothetical protein
MASVEPPSAKMKQIVPDAGAWRTPEDFYASLLPAIGAPSWHGRNLDAIEETIFYDDRINGLRPPYHVRIIGADSLDPALLAFLGRVERLFQDHRGGGLATLSIGPPIADGP